MELKFGFIFYFYLLTIQEKDNYPLPIRNPIVSSVHSMEVETSPETKRATSSILNRNKGEINCSLPSVPPSTGIKGDNTTIHGVQTDRSVCAEVK